MGDRAALQMFLLSSAVFISFLSCAGGEAGSGARPQAVSGYAERAGEEKSVQNRLALSGAGSLAGAANSRPLGPEPAPLLSERRGGRNGAAVSRSSQPGADLAVDSAPAKSWAAAPLSAANTTAVSPPTPARSASSAASSEFNSSHPLSAGLSSAVSGAFEDGPDPITSVSGSMKIEFSSRTAEEADRAGAVVDSYVVDLHVGGICRLKGVITRKPRVIGQFLGGEKQRLEFVYDLEFLVVDREAPDSRKVIGVWSGSLIADRQGVFDLSENQRLGRSSLRIHPISAPPSDRRENMFGGIIRGKNEQNSGIFRSVIRNYSRLVGGRRVVLQARRIDPLQFDGLLLAAGPLASFPQTRVTGNLDYDYDTGNWLTNALEFEAVGEGRAGKDTVAGSIKWEEGMRSPRERTGQYEFNLRFNEALYAGNRDESEFFEDLPDEEAFFAPAPAVPQLTGRIFYSDTLMPEHLAQDPVVARSEVSYALSARKLTAVQLINFLKLWLLLVGPVNDE